MILEKGCRDRPPDGAIRWGKQKCICVTGLPEMCWGGGVSRVGLQSPIRSLGRLPIGLGSLNNIECQRFEDESPVPEAVPLDPGSD